MINYDYLKIFLEGFIFGSGIIALYNWYCVKRMNNIIQKYRENLDISKRLIAEAIYDGEISLKQSFVTRAIEDYIKTGKQSSEPMLSMNNGGVVSNSLQDVIIKNGQTIRIKDEKGFTWQTFTLNDNALIGNGGGGG